MDSRAEIGSAGRTSGWGAPPLRPSSKRFWAAELVLTLERETRSAASPVGRFLRETFPHMRGTLVACRPALRAPLLSRPPGDIASRQIGMAVDYRIRYHFAIMPWRELAASRAVGFVVRPREARTETPGSRGLPVADSSRLSEACVSGFFMTLKVVLGTIAPHQRRPTAFQERAIARFCLILAALETLYRARHPAWPPPYFGDAPPGNAEALLALVPDSWVEDAAILGAAFAERYRSWQGTEAALNPSLAGSADVGGADADLVSDGCLWDIKTTTRRGAEGRWLRQLLGYVLLDYDDELAIERVGLLLPRQDTRVNWALSELIPELTGRDDRGLPALRASFREVCQRARAERARLRGAAGPRRARSAASSTGRSSPTS